MNTGTEKLRVGTPSKDGRRLYLGLDRDGNLTDGAPYVLLRIEIARSNESQVWPEVRLGEEGKKWFSVNSYEYTDFCDKNPIMAPAIWAWRAFLKAEAALCRLLGNSSLALPKEVGGFKGGVFYGGTPEETGRQHAAHHGTTDPRRIALANRSALGDDPEAIGRANKTAFIGQGKNIAMCNCISLEANPEKVGKANVSSFEKPELIAEGNKNSFSSKESDYFIGAMYSSFEGDPTKLINMFFPLMERAKKAEEI